MTCSVACSWISLQSLMHKAEAACLSSPDTVLLQVIHAIDTSRYWRAIHFSLVLKRILASCIDSTISKVIIIYH